MKKVVLLLFAVCVTVVSFAQDAAEKINQANDALQAKEYAKALELYESAMANLGDVQVPEAINFNIGLAAYNADKYEKAIQYFEKAVVAKANVDKAYEYMAGSYAKLDKTNEALDTYSKAIEANPAEKASLSYNAGIVAYKGKAYQKAVDFFTAAVAGNYKGETSQYYKAVALNKLNKDAEYKAALEEGVAKFPTDDKLSKGLANVYVSEGNDLYKKGAEILSAANTKVNAGSLSTADEAYVAEVGKAKKEFSSAVEVLEKALKLDAGNANATKLLEACKAAM